MLDERKKCEECIWFKRKGDPVYYRVYSATDHMPMLKRDIETEDRCPLERCKYETDR